MNQPIGSTCDDTPVNYYKQKKDWEEQFNNVEDKTIICPFCGSCEIEVIEWGDSKYRCKRCGLFTKEDYEIKTDCNT